MYIHCSQIIFLLNFINDKQYNFFLQQYNSYLFLCCITHKSLIRIHSFKK